MSQSTGGGVTRLSTASAAHHIPPGAGQGAPTGRSGPAPVDEHFPPSVVGGTITHKDTTTRVGPGPKVLATPVQGLADRKGHDRLMDKVPPPSDSAPAICPTCGDSPSARSTRLEGSGVAIGDYRCGAGHIWTTKWLVAA